MALKRVWMRSPNYYTGNNGRRLLVVHSSEGAQTYQSLGNFFANSANEVSSHTGIDNATRGTIGEYVKRYDSAWTAGNANGVAVQVELCTPSGASANWSRDKWLSQETMLLNLADWLREESNATGIPLKSLSPSQAQGNGYGVCQHKDLGSWGGGHVDCGPNFPMDYVMNLAKGQKPPTATVEGEEDVFYLKFKVNPDGSVNDDTSLSFTNEQKDGKHKVRFACRVGQRIRVDFTEGATVEGEVGYGLTYGPNIPEGASGAVVHIDEGDLAEPIAVSIGKV